MTEETNRRNKAGRRRDIILGSAVITLALWLGLMSFGNKQEADTATAKKDSLADQVTALCVLDDEGSRVLRSRFPALCDEAAQESPPPAPDAPRVSVVPGPTVVVTSVQPPIVLPPETITVREPPIVITGPAGPTGESGSPGRPGEVTTATVTTTPPATTVTETPPTETTTLPPPDTTTSQPEPPSTVTATVTTTPPPEHTPDLILSVGLFGICPPRRWF